MTERLSAIDQANAHVNAIEDAHILMLFDWQEKSQQRAEGCKCPSCIKEAGSAQEALCREVNRLHLSKETDEV